MLIGAKNNAENWGGEGKAETDQRLQIVLKEKKVVPRYTEYEGSNGEMGWGSLPSTS